MQKVVEGSVAASGSQPAGGNDGTFHMANLSKALEIVDQDADGFVSIPELRMAVGGAGVAVSDQVSTT